MGYEARGTPSFLFSCLMPHASCRNPGRPTVLISKLFVNPVNLTSGPGSIAEGRRNEIGVDGACCVIGLEHTRST